jgi:inner membrane protein
MPSSLSHAMIAVAGGSAVAPRLLLRPFLIAGAICAVLPDLDAIGRPFVGLRGDLEFLGGHRGFTHSLFFAALLGTAAACATLVSSRWRGYRVRFGIFIALCTASHGVLDTITSVGALRDGVQFLSPFSTHRYTISRHLVHGPFSELFYLFLPLVVLTRIVWHARGIPWPRRTAREPASIVERSSASDTVGTV